MFLGAGLVILHCTNKRKPMDIPIKEIDSLLFYNWNEEKEDWINNGKEKCHIFTDMQKIAVWLEREKRKVKKQNKIKLKVKINV